MNNRNPVRKIVYILIIVALLLPLYFLGKPASKGAGKITELRSRHNMGQADLGKLDPTSESMRLATLGMRGIASSILWIQADYYKEEKYFDRFSATLNQISLLQPHFISVWQHQAHNLSYNVSPEFEDYRQRYEWVKKGIDYLVKGTKFNSKKPILQYDLGHFVGNKMGKADEKRQYRDLFRNDNDFHQYFVDQGLNAKADDALGPDRKPDNWLVGRQWFEAAYELVAAGAKIKKSPHLLYSYGPLWQMYHAEAIEEEGVLDERARFSWERASKEWKKFGTRELGGTSGDAVILGSIDRLQENVADLAKRFQELTRDARLAAMEKKKQQIPETRRAIYEKPAEERNSDERRIAMEVEIQLQLNYQEIAGSLPREKQVEGLELAKQLVAAEEIARSTRSLRDQVNYSYWDVRAGAEQQEIVVEARRLMYEGNQLIDVADIKGAVDRFEASWQRWDKVFRYYPSMMTEEAGEDVYKSINRYKRLIDQDLDKSFILWEFMSFRRAYDADYLSFDVEKTLASWTEKSQKLGTPQDFFNTPLAETFGINKDGEQPAPDADSGKEESIEPPKEEGAEPR
ncbi:MAG: hypothetical protein KGQ51_13795 [Planctomycetes bacterium]|nr:hypothetical protein [Planctomycetota bacterium]